MPRKSYKKTSTKRTYKKGRKLSKYNVYTKTGAKAQAGQIYALSKKVNGMYKKLKQDYDTRIITSNINDILQYNNSVQVKFKSVSYAVLGSTTFDELKYASSGTSTGGVATTYSVPDSVLIKKVNFYVHWRFTKPYHDTAPAYMRIVIVRYRQSQASILSNTDILNELSDAIVKVRGPLHSGLKDSGFYILSDNKFKITFDKPNIDTKIRIPGCKFQKGELLYPRYSTFAVVATYNPNADPTNDDNFTEGYLYSKIVYTNPSFTRTL